ncbi:hypothetical protein BCV39_22485 [Vibrio sp. 10N.286.55.E10]|uniref:hypothetical protein n=1 Tax=unclassified Vibrio TaxID=2614977 RepID=UPI000C84914A|nr:MULTISPECIES: hypothetical protein [unclassified Vibrio]PME31224.1 hypothetical protein BCV39_22485 [Vibrio sp. 10N.286.55.E10]PME41104.1 hypothetical protein BCV40_21980 [Vibrio sp. 10N.286.55.E12]PME62715.1 hypothetical protein BCV32_21620 [Vibrio sp. 10N.286.55.C11]
MSFELPFDLPFGLFKKNKIKESWDEHVLHAYKQNQNFDDIIDSNKTLKEMPKPRSRKEVAKTILSSGEQPNLFAQRFASKHVLGDVGEAITELLLPSNYADVNQSGYDVKYQGALIEVKTTVSDRVSMSPSQFSRADYLLVHRYLERNGYYQQSYLIPVVLAKLVKHPKTSNQNVTFNLDKEKWIPHFSILPKRLVDYFNLREAYLNQKSHHVINKILNPGAYIQNFKMYPSISRSSGVLEVDSLFFQEARCECWRWELRFAYFQYAFERLVGDFEWGFDKTKVEGIDFIGFNPKLENNSWVKCT